MRVQGQPGLHNVTLSQNKRRKQTLGGRAGGSRSSLCYEVEFAISGQRGPPKCFKDYTEGQKQAC